MKAIPTLEPSNETASLRPRAVVAINRRARHGDTDITAALQVLEAHFGRLEMIEIDEPATLTQTLASAGRTASVQLIVVGGGDGTISSALPALLEVDKPLAVLPLGTANDFARTLGLPDDPVAAAQVAIGGRRRRIDVGLVNGRPFLNAAGIGFNVGLQTDLPAWVKRYLGPVAYPVGVAVRWRRHRAFSVAVRSGADGTPLRTLRAIQVTIANGRHYGGGMTAEQDARIDDGLLDLIIVLPRPWWRHIASAIRLRRGVYSDRAAVLSDRQPVFELATRRRMRITTDGEPTTTTPAAFSVAGHALEVLVP